MSSESKPTLLLIDGHSLAFRAFYALSPDSFRAPNGQHTNAVHGFISMLLTILQQHKPTHIAVAFDLSRSSFRTEQYPEYKGTRGETPPEFIGQTELLQEALAAMNIRTITRENFEADDILASLADQGGAAGYRVLVVSGDRDTFQLISETTTILYPVKGVLNLANMDDAAVLEKYGIHARQYPDLAALVGETSDNLPGIPGVGPKTAAKWLQQYGSLDAILAAADEISGKVGDNLREYRELAVRNRRLNHLVRDLAFDFEFDSLKLDGINATEVKELFGRLAFRSLTEKVLRSRELGQAAASASTPSANATAVASVMDLAGAFGAEELEQQNAAEGLVRPARDLVNPIAREVSTDELTAWLKQNHQVVGLAMSFAGTDPEKANVVQVGFASETERLYLNPKSNADLVNAIGAWLADDASKKAVHDHKLLQRSLLAFDARLNGADFDTLLMAYLIEPVGRKYSLDDLANQYLDINVERADPNALVAANPNDVSLDAWLAVCLAADLHERLKDQDQLKVYSEVDLVSSPVLADMEHVGVQVDLRALEALAESLSTEANDVAQECYRIIGREVNLASPKQLQTVLFEERGMSGTKAIKTGFSTNAAALAELYEQTQDPLLEKILAHREATKLRQMVETIRQAATADGRIHTTYSMTGTSTGRLSSENPNLQNIPIKNERGREMRAAFVSGEGYETLLTADYSQIEMRIMAHLSEDPGLIEAFNTGEDLHRFVGARIFGVAPSEVTSAMRSKVKAMSYGLVYGLSEYGLAKQLRISNSEAKQLMSDYFDRFGGVRRYLARVVDMAKQDGFTVTSYGRRRPFDELNSPVFQIRENARRAALNAPIQGTAADIMKLAMVQVHQGLAELQLKSRLLLQVHDELVLEVAPGELATVKQLVTDRMANVVKLSVPLEVHVGVGKNWDEAGH